MNAGAHVGNPIYRIPSKEIEGFDSLAELALNLRSSWNHASDEAWRRLDPELWGKTHNAWVVLQTVSRDRIASLPADPDFHKEVEDLVQLRRRILAAPAWFQQNHAKSSLACASYFSMEFMLSEALPIYSGGLGGVDTLVFAGGIGENAPSVRTRICAGLGSLGIELDGRRNAVNEGVISRTESRVAVRVIAQSVGRLLGFGAGRRERTGVKSEG